MFSEVAVDGIEAYFQMINELFCRKWVKENWMLIQNAIDVSVYDVLGLLYVQARLSRASREH